MQCDLCQRKMNYCYYIDDVYWREAVGDEKFKNNQGWLCAHCLLEKLGGKEWYIIYNEPNKKINLNG